MVGPVFFVVDFIGHDVEVNVVQVEAASDQGLVVAEAAINVGLVEVGDEELVDVVPFIGSHLDEDLGVSSERMAVAESQEIPLTKPRG